MTHKTRGIVLRTVRYGETSLIVTLFTELFGIQTYMVNGVRSSKKNGGKSAFFQPAAMLDLVVYHHEQKSIQRIKEFSWLKIYSSIYDNIIKNNIALYIVELMAKCLKQPEQNEPLFYFCEDIFMALDECNATVAANLSLFFALHLPHFFGFRLTDNYSPQEPVLNFREGCFVAEEPLHPDFLTGEQALVTSELLKVLQPAELSEMKLNKDFRRNLLMRYLYYYQLHIPDFGQLKTIQVLREVL